MQFTSDPGPLFLPLPERGSPGDGHARRSARIELDAPREEDDVRGRTGRGVYEKAEQHTQGSLPPAEGAPSPLFRERALMPLMNTPFAPGECLKAVESMEEGAQRDIAWAEYYYFSGQPEKAIGKAQPYLTSDDAGARLSACLICSYAYLHFSQDDKALAGLAQIERALHDMVDGSPQAQAESAFVAAAASILLHLPLPQGMPNMEEMLPLLPQGLRAFALYLRAHSLYLEKQYGLSAGIAEAALTMGGNRFPIPAIYLHLVAVMDYMSLKDRDHAHDHLMRAWALARPDDLIEGFGEHHGLIGGMLESAIKPAWPAEFKRIIEITYRFSAGWRRVHNPVTGEEVADNLTTTEFASAMLAARGWTNQEIADHLGVSINTAKRHLSHAMEKLGVGSRKGLERYMLR